MLSWAYYLLLCHPPVILDLSPFTLPPPPPKKRRKKERKKMDFRKRKKVKSNYKILERFHTKVKKRVLTSNNKHASNIHELLIYDMVAVISHFFNLDNNKVYSIVLL